MLKVENCHYICYRKYSDNFKSLITIVEHITEHMKLALNKKPRRLRLGHVSKKLLLVLVTGVALSLTARPDRAFKIIKSATREWQAINQRGLRNAIRRLYEAKMIDCRENNDGTIRIVLDDEGKLRVLQYDINNMKIQKPQQWDKQWRIVIFDIPEHKKSARDSFSFHMKKLGLLPMQKSVFVYPFDCRDEVNFIAEFFDVKPHVRFIVAHDIDIALHLKTKFRVS